MEWAGWIGAFAGVIGGSAGVVSAIAAWRQWQKVSGKIAMITDPDKAFEILPTWYTFRMMNDHWLFGLVTNDGRTIAITQISGVSEDKKWLDVQLAAQDDYSGIKWPKDTFFAVADDRRKASIQIDNIVAAVDLMTS